MEAAAKVFCGHFGVPYKWDDDMGKQDFRTGCKQNHRDNGISLDDFQRLAWYRVGEK